MSYKFALLVSYVNNSKDKQPHHCLNFEVLWYDKALYFRDSKANVLPRPTLDLDFCTFGFLQHIFNTAWMLSESP